jgi:transcriptional regulator with XRE-family HTH domain
MKPKVVIKKEALEEIETYMLKRNMNQGELADKLKTSQAYLSEMLSRNRTPGNSFRNRLMEELNKKWDDLFEIVD